MEQDAVTACVRLEGIGHRRWYVCQTHVTAKGIACICVVSNRSRRVTRHTLPMRGETPRVTLTGRAMINNVGVVSRLTNGAA